MLGASAFAMWAPAGAVGQLVALALQSGVLVLALHVAAAPRRLLRVGEGVAVSILLLVVGFEALTTSSQTALVSSLTALLVMAAMAAIVARLVAAGRVDRRTVFGAVCLYLLVGTMFASLFGAIAALSDRPFFADGATPTLSSLQYFSFTTLTTVGYGDLAPATRLGRALAITEALVGQIYLVTVVALLVGNVHLPGAGRHPGREPGAAGGGRRQDGPGGPPGRSQ